MKRAFIRGLWGIYDNSHKIIARRSKMDKDIARVVKNEFKEDFVTYVMGQDNEAKLKDFGIKPILMHVEPYMFDIVKYQYRHKLEIIRYAMEEDKYDEIIWLDWDCFPLKKVPVSLWDECNKKAEIQACLEVYRKKKCSWRIVGKRIVPNGGFVYIRDKSLPAKAIRWWNEFKQDNDEIAWARLIDDMIGPWESVEQYLNIFWENFETFHCNLRRMSVFDREKINDKSATFRHFL